MTTSSTELVERAKAAISSGYMIATDRELAQTLVTALSAAEAEAASWKADAASEFLKRQGVEAELAVAREALGGVKSKLIAAESTMVHNGWWTNSAGYVTDAALWIDQAWGEADACLAALACEGEAVSQSQPIAAPSSGRPEQHSDGWRDIASAPTDRSVIVRTKGGLIFRAAFDGEVEGPDGPCWAWQADEDLHPRCWTDAICWSSNEDDEPSDPPAYWMPLPAPERCAVCGASDPDGPEGDELCRYPACGPGCFRELGRSVPPHGSGP